MKCTNCGKPSLTVYCPNCEQFRERLERMRAEHKQFWRDVRAGKIELKRPPRKPAGGAHFFNQCKKHGPALVAAREAARAAQANGELPLSGQDAALPPTDR